MQDLLFKTGMVVSVLLLLTALAPPAVLAQEEEPAATAEGPAEDVLEGEDVDVSKIDQILRGEREVLGGEIFSYDPADRRDPFRSLLGGFEEGPQEDRPPGLPGMLIEELTLEGIIEVPGGILAFVQGRDKTSYILRPGTKLYNGEVKDIQPNKVIFRQQVNDPKQLMPYQDIVREINVD
jgi:hypothetical protein